MIHNRPMPNIASVFKSEIARLARKEIKSLVEPVRRINAQQRTEIAALKRRVQELERTVAQISKGSAKAPPKQDAEEATSAKRFSAKGFASQRRRLGLSAEDFGKLIGASGMSIHNWESGKAKPRAQFMPAIAAVRTMGKKEAAKRLAGE